MQRVMQCDESSVFNFYLKVGCLYYFRCSSLFLLLHVLCERLMLLFICCIVSEQPGHAKQIVFLDISKKSLF